EAGERALLLGGEAGALYLRYERMHDGAFHRAVKLLEKGAGASASEAKPEPAAPAKNLPMWHSPSPAEMLTMYDGLIAELRAAPNEANSLPTLEAGEASPAARLERLERMREMALDMIRRSQ